MGKKPASLVYNDKTLRQALALKPDVPAFAEVRHVGDDMPGPHEAGQVDGGGMRGSHGLGRGSQGGEQQRRKQQGAGRDGQGHAGFPLQDNAYPNCERAKNMSTRWQVAVREMGARQAGLPSTELPP